MNGLAPASGTGYGSTGLSTAETASPAPSIPTEAPTDAGARSSRPATAAPTTATATVSGRAHSSVATARPQRSARPGTAAATCSQNALPSSATSLCRAQPIEAAMNGPIASATAAGAGTTVASSTTMISGPSTPESIAPW